MYQETFHITCPHCWQEIELIRDPSVSEQSFIEDCEVCCRPMLIELRRTETGAPEIQVRAE